MLNEEACHAPLITTEYFIQLFEFIDQHQWIYNFPLTKFFSNEVWTQAPKQVSTQQNNVLF